MTIYYVDSATGSDANTGTSTDAALASISAVNQLKLQPGDEVLFAKDGTYTGQLTLKYSGTVGNPITIGAYGDGENAPVISGGTAGITGSKTQNIVVQDLTIANTTGNAISATAAVNWTVQNVHVVDAGTAAHSGAISFQNSTNVTVEGTTITGVTGDGIWISGGSGITLEHNNIDTVHGVTGDNIQITGATNVLVLDNSLDMSGQTDSTKGNLVVNGSDGVVIEGNTMVGGSYGASVNSDDVTIAYNNVYGQGGYTWSFGIGIGENNAVKNYNIYDNDIHDVQYGVAITGKGTATGARTDIDVHDNTFDNIFGAALKVDRLASGDFSGNQIDSNSTPTKISDDVNASGTFTVGENGTYVSTAPHAVADSYIAYTHQEVVQGDILTNDSSPTGGSVKLVEFDGQAITPGTELAGKYGYVTIDQHGNFVYTVNEASVASIVKGVADTFSYIVTDGSQETSSTLTIHLLPRHEIKPVAVNDGATVDAAGAAAGNVLANDTDVNHDTLYVRSADTTKVGAGVTHIAGEYGVLTIAADGDYTYQVDPTKVSAGEAALSDTFSYKISDGTLQDTGSLTIHINPDGLVMSPDFHI